MGGFGSGRWQSGKPLADHQRAIDVRRLHRDGLLKPGLAFSWSWSRNGETLASVLIRTDTDSLELAYQSRDGEGWRPWCYPVTLERTPCHYGGVRPWFLCPSCARRAALLYLAGSGMFTCRRCCGLAYASEREHPPDRAIRRAENIRRRLGWPPGIAKPPGDKPTGMHWRTFDRLVAEHDRAAGAAMAALSVWVGRSKRGLAGKPA